MIFASITGVVAYWRFVVSDRVLKEDTAAINLKGAAVPIEGCVDEVLGWAASCRAMRSLCTASTPRMAHACIKGKDRTPECQALGDRSQDTRYGYRECKARGATRKYTRKACAMAYRAIATHCAAVIRSGG